MRSLYIGDFAAACQVDLQVSCRSCRLSSGQISAVLLSRFVVGPKDEAVQP
jgi:hypothetical protein